MGLGMKSTHFQGAFMSFCDDAGASRDSDSSVPFCHWLLQCSVPCSKYSRKTLPVSHQCQGMFRHCESTEKVLLLPLGRFASWWQWPVKCWRWKSGLDISAPLKWGRTFQLWCQQILGHIHMTMRMVTRNQEEWLSKDMKYISNEPFSSIFSARTFFSFFFFLQGI